MENQITPAPASPIKKAIIALTALLVVGGVGATVYLNMSTGQGDPNEPPPSLSGPGGGLKGSFADESTQGFLKYTVDDVTEFEKIKSSLASKWGAAGTVKAGVNFYAINTDGLTMADLVKNYNPKVKDNRVLFVIYSAGQYMNGTTPLVKGFHTYPAGPFGAATNEIKKDDLSKINLPRNSGVIILSGQESENNGILDASVAPAGKLTGPILPDDKSGWVLVTGNGKLADILGAEKSRVVSAWGLKNANEFEKIDLNTYTFSTYHVAWLNLGPKSSVTDTTTPTLPTITDIKPTTAEQGQKGVKFIITGTNLAGATVSFTPSTDFKPVTGLTIDATNTLLSFTTDIDDSAKPDEFKEIKLTTAAGSVSDKTKFKVTAKIAAKPVLTAISLTEGAIDSYVNFDITGENIANITELRIGNVLVQTAFDNAAGGKKNVAVTLPTTLTVGSQDLVVVSPAGTSNALKFYVTPSTASAAPVSELVGKDVLVQYSPDNKKTFTDQWFEAKITRVTPTNVFGLKLNSYDITYKYPIKRDASNNQYYALTTGPGPLVTNLADSRIAIPADRAYLDTGKDFLVVVKQPTEKFGWSAKLNGKNSERKYSITYSGQTDAKEKPINNIYKPLSTVKISVETSPVPAGQIIDKGTDTTPPAKFTFTSPTTDQVWSLESVRKNGIDFYGNDPNTKSHLKSADGKFYMSYAWELRKGNSIVWESGWADNFANNPKDKTCVVNVTNHEGNKTDIWSCPSAVIPAEKLKDITAGTYTLTGWVGDSKQSPDPTSVTFKIEAAAAAADTSGVKEGTAVLGKFKDGFRWYPGKVSKVTTMNQKIWPTSIIAKVTTYDIDYDDGDKETGLSGSQVALFAEHPTSVEQYQEVVIKSPDSGNYWSANVKSTSDDSVTAHYYDEDKDATVNLPSVWISLAGVEKKQPAQAASIDDEIKKDLANLSVNIFTPEVNLVTGAVDKIEFYTKTDKLVSKKYGTDGKEIKFKLTRNGADVLPVLPDPPTTYPQSFQYLDAIHIRNVNDGSICSRWWTDGGATCSISIQSMPFKAAKLNSMQIQNTSYQKVEEQYFKIPYNETKDEQKYVFTFTYDDTVVYTQTYIYKRGEPEFAVSGYTPSMKEWYNKPVIDQKNEFEWVSCVENKSTPSGYDEPCLGLPFLKALGGPQYSYVQMFKITNNSNSGFALPYEQKQYIIRLYKPNANVDDKANALVTINANDIVKYTGSIKKPGGDYFEYQPIANGLPGPKQTVTLIIPYGTVKEKIGIVKLWRKVSEEVEVMK